jgi:hypothetical protein
MLTATRGVLGVPVLPADLPLLSGPGHLQETLTESEGRRHRRKPLRNMKGAGLDHFPGFKIASVIEQTMCISWSSRSHFAPSTYICSRFDRVNMEHELLAFEC